MTVVSKLCDAFVQLALQRSNAPAMQRLNSLASTGKKEDGWSEFADVPRLRSVTCSDQGVTEPLRSGTDIVTSHNLFHGPHPERTSSATIKRDKSS